MTTMFPRYQRFSYYPAHTDTARLFFFFLNDRAPTEFSPLPLPAALPILWGRPAPLPRCRARGTRARRPRLVLQPPSRNQVVLDAPLVRQPPDDEVPPIACLQRSQG